MECLFKMDDQHLLVQMMCTRLHFCIIVVTPLLANVEVCESKGWSNGDGQLFISSEGRRSWSVVTVAVHFFYISILFCNTTVKITTKISRNDKIYTFVTIGWVGYPSTRRKPPTCRKSSINLIT